MVRIISLAALVAATSIMAQDAKLPSMETSPTTLNGKLLGDCMTTLGLSYPLPQATLLAAKGSETKKALHGKNQFVYEGAVEVTPDGLLLKGAQGPAWASPYLWSGLKDVQVTAKLKLDGAPGKGVFGLKFGHTWAIVAQGPRLAFANGKAAFPAAGAPGAVDVTVPVGEWFTVSGWYSFDDGVFEAELNGKPVLKVAMPPEPFEDFMKTFGRPAPLTGIGIFAESCDVRVGEFSFLAGAPRRRVVVIGDSISQQAYWVLELEKALGEKVTNLGIGGDSAKMMALRFDRDVLPLKPEICIIFGGSNDIAWGSSPGAVQAALAQMAAKAKAAGTKPILCEILPRRGMAQKVPLYNVEIRKLATAQSLPLIAWHDAMLDAAKGEMKEGYAPDGTHTARLGGQAMVKAIDLGLFRK